jgi:hypothetical protein
MHTPVTSDHCILLIFHEIITFEVICCCSSFYKFAEKHIFINCCIFNTSRVSSQVSSTTTINHFINLYWKTFVSQLLKVVWYISSLLRDCYLIAVYYEAAEHIFHQTFVPCLSQQGVSQFQWSCTAYSVLFWMSLYVLDDTVVVLRKLLLDVYFVFYGCILQTYFSFQGAASVYVASCCQLLRYWDTKNSEIGFRC